MSVDFDCLVIGAGVVGLAIAKRCAERGRSVLIAEATEAIGTGISSRNSEVIHAGLYYPPNSLKAKLCVQGKQKLYAYCQQRGIAHKRLGKLLVATDPAQTPKLAAIAANALANQVDDLVPLSAAQAQELEPELHCVTALLSPSTGIVDSHALMLSLLGDAENHGAQLVLKTPFAGAQRRQGFYYCQFAGTEAIEISCQQIINAAGLSASKVAHNIMGLETKHIPKTYYCRGSYFTYSGRSPFSRLIYPMPSESGLGIHLTLDLGGQAKFGPDTEWIAQEDYQTDASRAEQFYIAIRRYWPSLNDDSLVPGYVGIRPKIVGPEQVAADFSFSGPSSHGMPNLINLFGIESPGLTSSLAIADYVDHLLNATSL